MQNNAKYVDERAVSQITGRALATLRNDRYVGQGIPYVKMGRSVRYRLDDVINYMESHKVQTNRI